MDVPTDTVEHFLQQLELEQLIPLFHEHRISVPMLTDLSDQDLQSIGVNALGDRKKIIAAIAAINETRAAEVEEMAERKSNESGASTAIWFNLIAIVAAIAVFFLFMHSDNPSYNPDPSIGKLLGESFLALVAATIYLLPSRIAFRKQAPYRWGIFLANCIFGYTVIGWFIILFLSLRLIDEKTAAVIGGIAAIAKRS